jgi:hypothetical protein
MSLTHEHHPKAVPRKLEISGFFKCFFRLKKNSGIELFSPYWALSNRFTKEIPSATKPIYTSY